MRIDKGKENREISLGRLTAPPILLGFVCPYFNASQIIFLYVSQIIFQGQSDNISMSVKLYFDASQMIFLCQSKYISTPVKQYFYVSQIISQHQSNSISISVSQKYASTSAKRDLYYAGILNISVPAKYVSLSVEYLSNPVESTFSPGEISF